MTQTKRRPSRFVTPKSVKYPLFGASLEDPLCEWVEIKHELTYRDQQRMQGAIMDSLVIKGGGDDGEPDWDEVEREMRVKLDVASDGPAKILTHVIDWNLEDGEGNIVDLCRDAVDMLDNDTAEEIIRVIDEHEKQRKAERGNSKRRSGAKK